MTYNNMIRNCGRPNCDTRDYISSELETELEKYFDFKRVNHERLFKLVRLYELHRIADCLEIVAGVWDDERSVLDEHNKDSSTTTSSRSRRNATTKKATAQKTPVKKSTVKKSRKGV